ncbi:hypothetical protein P2318_10545 [Myxococcaceae bacterium GXIMD 01537]
MPATPSLADVQAKIQRRRFFSLGCTLFQMLCFLPAFLFSRRDSAPSLTEETLMWVLGLLLLLVVSSVVDRAVSVCPGCKRYVGFAKSSHWYTPSFCVYECGRVTLFARSKK